MAYCLDLVSFGKVFLNSSQGRSQPLGSFLSTSFDHQLCSFFNRRSFMSCCTRSPHRFFCHLRLQASSVDLCRHNSFHAVFVFKTLKLHPPLPPPSSTQN